MPIDEDLLAMLACPSEDHGALRLEVENRTETLVCTVCLSTFPVEDGIPVLLLDEATPGPNGVGKPANPA